LKKPSQRIWQRKFRHDLYYRLDTLCIHGPPLRDHVEDGNIIAEEVVRTLGDEEGYRRLVTCGTTGA